MAKAQLAFISNPAVGNLVPIVEFAVRLTSRDPRLSAAILIVTLPQRPIVSAYVQSCAATAIPGVRFVHLPAVDPPTPDQFLSSIGYISVYIQKLKPLVKQALANLGAESPRVAALFVDMFCTPLADVADELSIPCYLFFASPASFLGFMVHLSESEGQTGSDSGESAYDTELSIPGFVNKVPKGVLPSAVLKEFLGSLSNLVYLNLSRACFAEDIPLRLGNLSNLQYLDLNDFYLQVNNLEWASDLPSLKHLDLSGISVRNAQGWLQSMTMLSSLQFLGLADCHLPKVDPAALQVNFSTSLEFLDLSGNNLGSVIPNWLLNLSSITHLDLSSSFAGGAVSFPTEIINNNKQLAFLGLRHNSMRGELPKNLSNLCHLVALKLGRNDLTRDISAALGNPFSCLQNTLRYLDLEENKISGRLGDEIGYFKNLEYIGLSDNKLTGIPESIGQLSNLEFIDLSKNSIVGPIPESLFQLSSLKQLDLKVNKLTGRIPENIGQLSNLEYIDLWGNSIEGPIPESLPQLSSLKCLDLGHNKLTGRIPKSIGLLSNLVELDLSNNLLERVVTELHLANLTSLTHLDISSNELAVKINPKVVAPFQLYTIRMSNCKVGPQFPTWLRAQRNIGYLDLSNASISGIAPGFATGFLGVCCSLYFKHSWRRSFFLWSDKIISQLLVMVEIKLPKVTRKRKMNPIR
ncbi:hypothetical protein CRG98_041279 [Punica granatum]|uniref:Disease resistance R13L4/SHOC-2-like LRR domain-containing protein n=1 Tax=Punica granatum TaxID=22663 RepID=A0A2I0I2X5_PUNGR|nr:hypothetical protein CRG98_041279 [Punica granatum]